MAKGVYRSKRLVVCCDGTWNDADSGRAETNVAVIARAVRAGSGDDHVPQQTLYMRGIGSTGFALQRIVDGATGNGMDDNIRSAYMFLAQNYVPGDEIFLFGFSRGAFTARSLVGLISACGLLKRQSLGRIQDAWAFYRTAKVRNPQAFLSRYPGVATHESAEIRFLGVWDTVGALGIPSSILGQLTASAYEFHDTTPSQRVRTARQALAVDEFRDQFVPTLWTAKDLKQRAELSSLDLRQVWFPGAHADVGGGYEKHRGLSDLALEWMAREAAAAGLRLDFDDVLTPDRAGDPLAPQHDPRQGWALPDRWTPTYRRVCEANIEVRPWQTLYVPRDRNDNPLLPLNESLHPSVAARYGRTVQTIFGDGTGKARSGAYEPINIPPSLLG